MAPSLAAPKPLVPAAVAARPSTRLCHLSVEEIADRRMKGLCYNCLEKFTRNHVNECTFKGIYWLEVEDSNAIFDDQPTDDDVQISLLAMIGIRTS